MSSLNASSVAQCQQWRNDLLMKASDPVPINAHELCKEPAQQKYLRQHGLLGLLEQQGQQGQHGQHDQMGQLGQNGQHGQSAQLGQNGQIGQHGNAGNQGNLGLQGLPGQQGFSGQQSISGQIGHSGQNGFSGQNGYSGQNGFAGQNGFSGQNGLSGHNGFAGQNSLSGQQAPVGQQTILFGQPLILSQPGQPGVQGQPGQPGQMLASATVCCDQEDCERSKMEQLVEQYSQEPTTPFTVMTPTDGCDPQSGKKDPSEQYMYCPCCMSRGQLITICCTGRDCDNSTKIDEVPMGPPEEKRAKTTFNQNQYKY